MDGTVFGFGLVGAAATASGVYLLMGQSARMAELAVIPMSVAITKHAIEFKRAKNLMGASSSVTAALLDDSVDALITGTVQRHGNDAVRLDSGERKEVAAVSSTVTTRAGVGAARVTNDPREEWETFELREETGEAVIVPKHVFASGAEIPKTSVAREHLSVSEQGWFGHQQAKHIGSFRESVERRITDVNHELREDALEFGTTITLHGRVRMADDKKLVLEKPYSLSQSSRTVILGEQMLRSRHAQLVSAALIAGGLACVGYAVYRYRCNASRMRKRRQHHRGGRSNIAGGASSASEDGEEEDDEDDDGDLDDSGGGAMGDHEDDNSHDSSNSSSTGSGRRGGGRAVRHNSSSSSSSSSNSNAAAVAAVAGGGRRGGVRAQAGRRQAGWQAQMHLQQQQQQQQLQQQQQQQLQQLQQLQLQQQQQFLPQPLLVPQPAVVHHHHHPTPSEQLPLAVVSGSSLGGGGGFVNNDDFLVPVAGGGGGGGAAARVNPRHQHHQVLAPGGISGGGGGGGATSGGGGSVGSSIGSVVVGGNTVKGSSSGGVSGSGGGSPDEMCIICLTEAKNAVLVPCGHQSMCHDCALEWLMSNPMRQCPICRQRVKRVQKIFRT